MKYNSRMQLKKLTDKKTGRTYDYVYDTTDRLVSTVLKGEINVETFYEYDGNNNVSRYVYATGGKTVTEGYTYGKDNLVSAVTNSLNGSSLSYSYDELNRLKTETVSFNGKTLSHGYTYAASARGGNYTTSKTETETIGNIVYKYVYDKTGNITAIYKKAKGAADGTYKLVASYGYDSFGQLKRENVAPDVYSGYTMMYNYDNGGNIRSIVMYPYTTGNLGTALSTITYGYADSNWKDKLTSINGSAITYDAIGNPLSYKGYTLKWTGRKLDSLYKSGLNVTYKYDSDGIRTSKTVNGIKYTYYYEGSQLRFEQRGNEKLYYSYNGYGHLSGITHVNSAGTVNNYYVMTNARGDVEQIYGVNGTLAATYSYDAWGNVLAVKDGNGAVLSGSTNHIGNINPIRYRGYYYDVETKLYYLNSRYYDAEVGRFISADGYISTGQGVQGYNMFAYCGNNPVIHADYNGKFWTVVGLIVTIAIIAFVCTSSTNKEPYYKQQAKQKYNENNVKVYERGNSPSEKGIINAEIYYPNDSVSNISIDKSLDVDSSYEQEAVLDVIIASPYYSEEVYGSKDFMKAQWVAHNACYDIASSSDIGFWIMQRLSGSDDPIQSSNSLDLRSNNNLLKRQRILYTIISWVY